MYGLQYETEVGEKKGQFESWMRTLTQIFRCIFTILQALRTLWGRGGMNTKSM